MSKPLIIEDEPLTPELAQAFESARRNRLWFNEHVEELAEVVTSLRQAGNCLLQILPKRSEDSLSKTTRMNLPTCGTFNAKD